MENSLKNQFIKGISKLRIILGDSSNQSISEHGYLVLNSLYNRGININGNDYSLKISQLTKILELSKVSLSKKLRKLESLKYIKKITNEFDRRSLFISLTENGIKKLEDIKKNNDLLSFKIINSSDQEELSVINNSLEMLISIINKCNGTE